MKKAKFRLWYNRKNKLNKDGKANVQIDVYLNGARKFLTTDIGLKPEEWNNKKSEVTSKHSNFMQLNSLLKKYLIDLETKEISFINANKPYTIENIVAEEKKQDDSLTFNDFIRDEIENAKVCKKTINLYSITLRNIEEFSDKKLSFSEMNYRLISNFDKFLHKKGLHINTIAKRHSVVKFMCNQAIKKGFMDKYPYREFKTKKIPSMRVALNSEEVHQIENLKFSTQVELFENVRDMFLFSCYTGLRFSDIQELNKKDIQITKVY